MKAKHTIIAAIALATTVGSTAAIAQLAPDVDLSGSWNTHSEAINGQGSATDHTMSANHRNGSVVFTYSGGTMTCHLEGNRCSGIWQGNTGSGGFSIRFNANGRVFSGRWWYGSDRSNAADFSGHR